MGEWVPQVSGVVRLRRRQTCNSSGHHDSAGKGLVSFGSLLGPYSAVVKRVAGVREGARSSRTFFFIFVTLRNRKESFKTLDITVNVCELHPNLSWHRGFCGKRLSRSILFLPLSRFGNA